jgi:hypothetical protein
MSSSDASAVAFLAAAAAHAGFQLTVTLLVYPALGRVGPEGWLEAHRRHSRSIVPLVGVLYAALAVTSAPYLVHHLDVVGWLGFAGAWGAMLTTATLAAPLHGRLSAPDPRLWSRLVVVDRWRTGLACLALAGALVSALSP